MKRQIQIDKISEQLAVLGRKIKLQNGINLTDLNIHAENLFRDFLNMLYGYHLGNCNTANQNTASIDLHDENNRLAIQVTANTRRAKIQDCIDSFCHQGLHKKFDRLIVLLVGDSKSYREDFSSPTEENGVFTVRRNEDVWDFQKLMRDIGDLTVDRLEDVYGFLERELGSAFESRRRFQAELPAHRQLSRIISYGRDVFFTIQKSKEDAMEQLQKGMERLQLIASIAFFDTCLRTQYQDFVYLGSILAEEDVSRVTFSFEITSHITHFVTAYKELLGYFKASDDSVLGEFDLSFRTVQPVPLVVSESVAYRGRLVGPSSISIEIEKPIARMSRRLRTSELLKLISQGVHHEPVLVSEFLPDDSTTEILEYFAKVNDSGTLSLDDFQLDLSDAEKFRILR